MNASAEKSASQSLFPLIAAVLAGLALLGFGYLWFTDHSASTSNPSPATPVVMNQDSPAAAVAPPEASAPVATPPEQNAKPQHPMVPPPKTLDNSDTQVKLAMADIAPDMAEWLAADQPLRKWVLAIDLMADGHVPKQYRPLAFPIAHFEPAVFGSETDAQYSMKPEIFSRANVVITLLTAIDPALLAQYYRAWQPILEKAYQEQGKKDKFDQRLRAALQHLIDAKPLDTAPVLKKHGAVIYVYADDKLEAASDVEKMMWRLGPDNSAKLQAFAQQLLLQLPKTK